VGCDGHLSGFLDHLCAVDPITAIRQANVPQRHIHGT
jgi:hypothetical protein